MMDDGGPVFPTMISAGLSARDWFAGQALTGLIAMATGRPEQYITALLAYEYADAMVAARSPSGEK